MKLTKQRLKILIKEELTKSPSSLSKLNEMGLGMDSSQYFTLKDDLKNFFSGALYDLKLELAEEGLDDLVADLNDAVDAIASKHNILL